MGLHRAGFRVLGVDVESRGYPFAFRKDDAMTTPLDGYDFIWASPPCQHYSTATPATHKGNHPDLVAPTRRRLLASDTPYCMENVIGAPLRDVTILCGEMFNLKVIRHRQFESSFTLRQPRHKEHKGTVTEGDYWTIVSKGSSGRLYKDRQAIGLPGILSSSENAIWMWQKVMEMDWVPNHKGMALAIPPVFAEYIGLCWLNEKTDGQFDSQIKALFTEDPRRRRERYSILNLNFRSEHDCHLFYDKWESQALSAE